MLPRTRGDFTSGHDADTGRRRSRESQRGSPDSNDVAFGQRPRGATRRLLVDGRSVRPHGSEDVRARGSAAHIGVESRRRGITYHDVIDRIAADPHDIVRQRIGHRGGDVHQIQAGESEVSRRPLRSARGSGNGGRRRTRRGSDNRCVRERRRYRHRYLHCYRRRHRQRGVGRRRAARLRSARARGVDAREVHEDAHARNDLVPMRERMRRGHGLAVDLHHLGTVCGQHRAAAAVCADGEVPRCEVDGLQPPVSLAPAADHRVANRQLARDAVVLEKGHIR